MRSVNEYSIPRLIDGTFPDPDGGPALTVPVRSAAIAGTKDGEDRDRVAALDLGGRLGSSGS
jgi:hypothetical protein